MLKKETGGHLNAGMPAKLCLEPDDLQNAKPNGPDAGRLLGPRDPPERDRLGSLVGCSGDLLSGPIVGGYRAWTY